MILSSSNHAITFLQLADLGLKFVKIYFRVKSILLSTTTKKKIFEIS